MTRVGPSGGPAGHDLDDHANDQAADERGQQGNALPHRPGGLQRDDELARGDRADREGDRVRQSLDADPGVSDELGDQAEREGRDDDRSPSEQGEIDRKLHRTNSFPRAASMETHGPIVGRRA